MGVPMQRLCGVRSGSTVAYIAEFPVAYIERTCKKLVTYDASPGSVQICVRSPGANSLSSFCSNDSLGRPQMHTVPPVRLPY